MTQTLPQAKVRFAICCLLAGLSGAWLWEAYTCGFCGISTYVPPVLFIGSLAMAGWVLASMSKAALRREDEGLRRENARHRKSEGSQT